MNHCQVELPESPTKKKAFVPGLAKEAELKLQNECDKKTYENDSLSDMRNAEVDRGFLC